VDLLPPFVQRAAPSGHGSAPLYRAVLRRRGNGSRGRAPALLRVPTTGLPAVRLPLGGGARPAGPRHCDRDGPHPASGACRPVGAEGGVPCGPGSAAQRRIRAPRRSPSPASRRLPSALVARGLWCTPPRRTLGPCRGVDTTIDRCRPFRRLSPPAPSLGPGLLGAEATSSERKRRGAICTRPPRHSEAQDPWINGSHACGVVVYGSCADYTHMCRHNSKADRLVEVKGGCPCRRAPAGRERTKSSARGSGPCR
jgi:hypothetical protein